MRNYLSAECYKAFRRKYFYIALAVCLGLELVRILADEETAAALKKKIQYER